MPVGVCGALGGALHEAVDCTGGGLATMAAIREDPQLRQNFAAA
jgi:hypothetical protein